MSILELDVGNTFLKWRIMERGAAVAAGRFFTSELSGNVPQSWRNQFTEVRVASVAGKDINAAVTEMVVGATGLVPKFACTSEQCAGVTNSYADPSRMGVDRWLVMLAGYQRAAGACCIVDCGSAITVDYVSADGKHLGGYIIPGLRLMARALQIDTAEVIVDQAIDEFDTRPGKHTSAAVTHGINFAFQAIQAQVLESLEQYDSMQLYITGGDGALFHTMAGQGEYIGDLVMDGLQWSEWR